jgi:predicted MarR family transcription regulator
MLYKIEYKMLKFARDFNGKTIADISRMTFITNSSLYRRTIPSLEKMGLITTEKIGRKRIVKFTDSGMGISKMINDIENQLPKERREKIR